MYHLWRSLCCLCLALTSIEPRRRIPFELHDDHYKLLPKLDLHAHLHGSIRRNTLKELVGPDVELPSCRDDLQGCFNIFKLIHEAVNTLSLVERVTREVFEDFMHDGVIYAELRSTPRVLNDGTSKRAYLERLIALAEEHNHHHGHDMIVRLIVSIDRGSSLEEAEDTLSVVRSLMKSTDMIVGIDFSGNPISGGDFAHFMSVIKSARESSLNVTVHAAEVAEPEDTIEIHSDTSKVLQFKPDRIGHLLFLKEYHYDKLFSYKDFDAIPLEIAPTSNYFSLGLENYENHPTLGILLEKTHPFVICSDDTGVFDTTLSQEFKHVHKAYQLSPSDLVMISRRSIQYIFDPSLNQMLIATFMYKLHLFESAIGIESDMLDEEL